MFHKLKLTYPFVFTYIVSTFLRAITLIFLDIVWFDILVPTADRQV